MRRRILAVIVVMGALTAVMPEAASAQVTVPPACVKVPLIGSLQLQVGYCPA